MLQILNKIRSRKAYPDGVGSSDVEVMNKLCNGIFAGTFSRISLLFLALPVLASSPDALAQSNPWGTGGQSPGSGFGQQDSRSLSFPARGVICDSSVSVCFNASGAALPATERQFGRPARLRLESNLINNPIIDVTFADGRHCNFNLRGCWTNCQRASFDQQLQGSEAEGLGQVLGGLLQQLFGGN